MFDISSLFPYLSAVGTGLIDNDANDEGTDDFVGNLLVFAAEAGTAVKENDDLPSFPAILSRGFDGKVNSGVKATLRIARPAVQFASLTVTNPKARTVFKYVYQTMGLLLADKPVPAVASLL